MQNKIVKVVELHAPVARVWRALTDHNEFGTWFRVALDGPFETGKVTRGRMTYPGYEGMLWESLTEQMDHERRFSFFWPSEDRDGAIDDPEVPKMRVEFRLEPTAGGTRLTITESGFASVPDPRRLEVLRDNTAGWDEQAENIAAYVRS